MGKFVSRSEKIVRRGKLFLAALVLGALAACGGSSDKDLIASAKSYLEKKDGAAAIVQLKSALQKNPQSGEARYLLGKALLAVGDAEAAALELNKAMDLRYDENDVLPELARAMLQQGAAKKLVDLYARSTLQDANAIADLKTSLAAAYQRLGMRDRSEAALADALAASAEFAPAMLLQARMKATNREFDGATALVDRVLAKNANDQNAWQLKGQVALYGKADPDAAFKAFGRAVEIDPRFVPGHLAIMRLRLEQRDRDGFKSQLDALQKALPNHPETRYFQAQLAFIDKDFKKARELTQQLLRIAPDNSLVLQLAGAIEFQNQSLLQAEVHLKKALQNAPDMRVARRLLGQTYLRAGQIDKALATLAPLLTKDPDAESLALAAEAQLLRGDAAQAEQLFARAAKLNPDDTRIRTAIALTRLSKGETDAAFAELESAAAADSGTYADMALISAHMRRNDFDGALRAIAALERKQADKPFAANVRGRVQLALKQNAAARASFERAISLDPVYFPPVASLAALDLAEGKPEQAKTRFENILKTDPKNLQALLSLAELRARTGGTAKEIGELVATAVKLNPTEPAPRVLLIGLYLQQRDTKGAMVAAQDAMAAFPDRPEILAAVAQAQFNAGDSQQAISTYTKLAAAEPLSPNAYLRLAEVYLAIKDRPAATESYRRALEITPDLLVAQLGLIALALDEKRIDDALKISGTVQQQRPMQGIGWSFEGDIEHGRGRWDAALAAYRSALQREKNPQLAVKAHRTLLASGAQAEASRFAAGWLKDQPRDAIFLGHLGEIAMSKGDMATAESLYRAVIAIHPDNALALNNIAFVLLKTRKESALPFAEKANQLAPGQPALMDTLALALGAERQFPRAIEIQKKAIELAPQYFSLRLSLAQLFIQAGDKTQARKELETLAALGEKFDKQPEVSRLIGSL